MKLLIREYRYKRNYSLRKLSRLAGISRSTLSEIETGKHFPGFSTFLAISDALEVCPRCLIHCGKKIDCRSCSYHDTCCSL